MRKEAIWELFFTEPIPTATPTTIDLETLWKAFFIKKIPKKTSTIFSALKSEITAGRTHITNLLENGSSRTNPSTVSSLLLWIENTIQITAKLCDESKTLSQKEKHFLYQILYELEDQWDVMLIISRKTKAF